MEDRDGDLRVPIIFLIFCVCVTMGGSFLIIYIFMPNVAQPWYPPVALILIGCPWLFWFLTYLYTCFKICCCGGQVEHTHSAKYCCCRAPTIANPGMEWNFSQANSSSSGDSNCEGNHAIFMECGLSHAGSCQDGGNASVKSSQEIDMPLDPPRN